MNRNNQLFTPAIPHLFKHSRGKHRATTLPGISLRRFFQQRRSQWLQAGALALREQNESGGCRVACVPL